MKKNSALIFLFGYSAFFFQNLFTLYFNYINNNTANLFLSAGFYLSMSVGALLAMRFRNLAPTLPALHLFNAVNFLIAFVLLFLIPSTGFIALLLSLVGVGFSQSIVFRQSNIRTVIIFLSLGAIFYFVTASPLFHLLGDWLIFACVILPALTAGLEIRRTAMSVAFGALVVVCLGLQFGGIFSPPSWQETNRFARFEPVKVATVYTPTIISDVLETQGLHYIITNGSRFSRIYDQYVRDLYQINPLYDSPYMISQPKKVLIIGPAGGLNVFRAVANKAEEIFAVDINPAVAEFATKRFPEISMGLFLRPEVHSITAEGRSFVESTKEKFDLIVVQGVQTGTMATATANAFMESFLFTNESVRAMLRALNDDGLIFFEEDSVWSNRERNLGTSVLKNLHFSLLRADVASSDNSLLYEYTIPVQFAGLRNQVPIKREVLFVSKKSLSDAKAHILKSLGDFEIKYLDVANRPNLLSLSDDRPYLVSQEFGDFQTLLVGLFAILTTGFIAFCMRTVQRQHLPRLQSGSMFLAGCSYTLLLVSLAGPMYLLSGNPNAAVLLINLALVVSSLLLAFVRFYTVSTRFLLLCGAYLVSLFVFYIFKDQLVYATISNGSHSLRLIVAVSVAVFLFLFIEAPYYAVLAAAAPANKPAYFLFGKLGALCGVLFGLVCQLQFGFLQSMAACLICYGASVLLIFTAKRIDRV